MELSIIINLSNKALPLVEQGQAYEKQLISNNKKFQRLSNRTERLNRKSACKLVKLTKPKNNKIREKDLLNKQKFRAIQFINTYIKRDIKASRDLLFSSFGLSNEILVKYPRFSKLIRNFLVDQIKYKESLQSLFLHQYYLKDYEFKPIDLNLRESRSSIHEAKKYINSLNLIEQSELQESLIQSYQDIIENFSENSNDINNLADDYIYQKALRAFKLLQNFSPFPDIISDRLRITEQDLTQRFKNLMEKMKLEYH